MLQACLLIPLLLAATAAEKKGEDAPLRMSCQLRDGSLVIGDVDPATKLKLATGTGKLNIPLRRIARISVSDDRETTKVFLSNGDQVTGFAEMDGFSLKTASGRTVFVHLPTLKKCTVRVGDQSLLTAKVYASGSWLNMKPVNAIDNNIKTGWNAGAWNGWIELDLGQVQVVSRVQFTVAHVPAGRSTWNMYLSQKPIKTQRNLARFIKQVAGNFREGSTINVRFPPVKGRYLQIQCPRSVSWVMIYEIDVFALKARKNAPKPVKAKSPP